MVNIFRALGQVKDDRLRLADGDADGVVRRGALTAAAPGRITEAGRKRLRGWAMGCAEVGQTSHEEKLTMSTQQAELIQGKCIWNITRVPDRERTRMEFPHLLRFRDSWFCSFREGEIHHVHPSGRVRVIRSIDGEQWETAAVMSWQGGDVRDSRLSVTAEGCLMLNCVVKFCSDEPGADGHYGVHPSGASSDEQERHTVWQSVTWLSSDGVHWSSAYACPTGANTWRWDAVWHGGMGYSVGYGGKDVDGTLYRTRDGKSWRTLRESLFPPTGGNEAALAFGPDGTGYCLLRDAQPRSDEAQPSRETVRDADGHSVTGQHRDKVLGGNVPMFGIGEAPSYQNWHWKPIRVDYGAAYGGEQPADRLFRAPLGGPNLLRLSTGRLIAAARMLGPDRDDGRATIFGVTCEPGKDTAVLTRIAECDGTSYPGVAEHEGRLWISFISRAAREDTWEVHLANMAMPE